MRNFTKVHVAQDARTELHDSLSLTGAEISVNNLPAGAGVPFVHSHKKNSTSFFPVRVRLSLMEKRLNCTQEILSELLRQQKDSSLQGMILQSVLYVFRFRRTLLRDTQQRML